MKFELQSGNISNINININIIIITNYFFLFLIQTIKWTN